MRQFWAPVPWLLEATIIIQIFLGEVVEASVIGGLLIFDAFLSYLQEGHAQKVLALLRQQLRLGWPLTMIESSSQRPPGIAHEESCETKRLLTHG